MRDWGVVLSFLTMFIYVFRLCRRAGTVLMCLELLLLILP